MDRERLERRKAEEEEKRIQAEQEAKREEQQKKRDQQIEMKKKQFYRKMNGSGSSYKPGGSDLSGKSALSLEKSGTNIECKQSQLIKSNYDENDVLIFNIKESGSSR